jgi:hypothetical protein
MGRVEALHQKFLLVFSTWMHCSLNPVGLYSVFYGEHQLIKMMLWWKQQQQEKILLGYRWPNEEVLVPHPVQSESHLRGY